MKVGYARVSTLEQNEERQIETLQAAGCEKLFLDKLSGKDIARPNLQAMLDYVREGDVVVVNEYSRLARSTKDLLDIVDDLRKKGVELISQKEKLDTSTPQGKFMLTVFAGVAEFERALLLQRQAEGIALAKKQGKYTGRKQIKKPQNWPLLKAAYQTRQITATKLAQLCNVSRPTVYKWLSNGSQIN